MSKRAALGLGLVGLVAVLAWAGQGMLFSTFMLYDDEGYVLLSLRNFGRHGALYDQVYSQYGPFFYVAYDALHRLLGFAWTNTAGRWITLVNWLGTAACCTLLARRARLPWSFVLFVLADVFAYLWIMISEPMHPGGTVTLLVAATAWLGWEALRADRMTGFALITGIAGALLALVKINAGVFLVLSAGSWLLLASPTPLGAQARRILPWLGLLLPPLLMRALLDQTWVLTFAMMAGPAIAAALLAVSPVAARAPARLRPGLVFVGAGCLVTVLVAGLLLLRGTSFSGFIHGAFVAPLQHPAIYAFPVRWRPGVVLVGFAGLILVGAARFRPDDVRLARTIAWTRVIAAGLFQLTLPWFSASQGAIGLCYGLPLAGVFACPLRPGSAMSPASRARAWLAVLLVFQSLQVYPVAGSQLNWGTFLWIPLMLLGLHAAMDYLLADATEPWMARIRLTTSLVLLTLTGFTAFTLARIAYAERQDSEPFELPGAERVALPADTTSALRIIAENARAHGDMLFSLPGSYSLNLWSDLPTPTLANVTHWFSLLTTTQQQAIIDRLEGSPRSVFVVQHSILGSLLENGFHPAGPLMDYLRRTYHRAFAVESYTLWVRNGRTIAPLSTGRFVPPFDATPGMRCLELTLAPRSGEISSVEVWDVVDQPRRVLSLGPATALAQVTPLSLDGRALAPPRKTEWPLSLHDTTRFSLCFIPLRPLPADQRLLARLLSADGRRLGFARVLPADSFELPPAGAAFSPAPPQKTISGGGPPTPD